MGWDVWLNNIREERYGFLDAEIEAIKLWAEYKHSKQEIVTIQQIELTLKSLVSHKAAKYDIVYMIHQSIAGNYRKIMDSTNACIAFNFKTDTVAYQAKDCIKLQSEIQKKELCSFLEECYMQSKIDPRTKSPLTDKQKKLIAKHFNEYKTPGIRFADYIYQNEVLTGISLLEQGGG